MYTLLAQPAIVLADPADTRQLSLAEDKAKALGELTAWDKQPVLPSCPISGVLRFSVANGLLKIDWPLVEGGCTGGLLNLSDLPGKAQLKVYGSPDRVGGEMFEVYDFSDSRLVFRHLQVMMTRDSSLQVIEDDQYVDTLRSVSLIEKSEEADALTLRVQKLGDPPQNGIFYGSSLDDLRQKYPLEYSQYLRPMFRALRQEQEVAGVNSNVAWQVVADQWIAPPDLKPRVEALVSQLNSDDFSVRNTAQKQLHQIGEPAALYLMHRNQTGLSAEQKARVNSLLADYLLLDADQAKGLAKDEDFLLDCLLDNDPALRLAAMKILIRLTGHEVKVDLQAGPDARGRQIAAIREEMLRATTQPSP